MQIGDYLYFAPGIRFHEVKVDTPQVVRLYQKRIEGYYIEPARILADLGVPFGFASSTANA